MGLQLRTVAQHIRRTPYHSAAAAAIVSLIFFVGLVVAYLTLAANTALSFIDRKPQIIVFFNETITSENQIAGLTSKLSASGKAAKVQFVSKEAALKIYQEKNQKDPLLLELVTAKILPASLEIAAVSSADLPGLYALVKDEPGIDEISYQQEVVRNIVTVIAEARKFGLAVIGFLLLTSILIVVTTVGMKISYYKEEIEVERLVGASPFFISWPFLVEGMVYGSVGAVAALVLGGVSFFWLFPKLSSYLAGFNLVPLVPGGMLTVLGISLGVGLLVGLFGSWLAVQRYLKD